MFPNLDYDDTKASKYAQTLRNYLKKPCRHASLDHVISRFPDTLPMSVLTVRPVDAAESGVSVIGDLMSDVQQLCKTSVSVNRRLKMLKPLLKGDPAKPKDEELDGSIERQLASLVQMKDVLSSLKPKKKRFWNNVLAGMVNDLSKTRRRCVTTQEVEGHDTEVVAQEVVSLDAEAATQEVANSDQEVTDQDTASVNEAMSSQE